MLILMYIMFSRIKMWPTDWFWCPEDLYDNINFRNSERRNNPCQLDTLKSRVCQFFFFFAATSVSLCELAAFPKSCEKKTKQKKVKCNILGSVDKAEVRHVTAAVLILMELQRRITKWQSRYLSPRWVVERLAFTFKDISNYEIRSEH